MYPPLPDSYTEFLNNRGAFEGFTDGQPGYIAMWKHEELTEFNRDLSVSELAPGFIAFAGNGGGDVLAFDTAGEVFMLPMIGMESRYANRIADSFSELVARFQDAK